VIRDQLEHLIHKADFEPFRIKLVNGDRHDVFDPQSVALMKREVSITPLDQSWAIFPIDKIASLESLIEDYAGELANHDPTPPPP
jgi:hypothetical protein